MNEHDIAEQCMCNVGIANGNMAIRTQKQKLDEFKQKMDLPQLREQDEEEAFDPAKLLN
jgi:hypothetical protein